MPPAQAGVAAAVASTSRQVGSTMGVAVLGALSGGALAGGIGPSFAAATHAAWWVCVGLGIIVLVLAIVTTTGWAQDTATRTAERLREPVGDREPAPRAEQQPAAAG
jgi:hypothetical protein